MNDTIEKLVAEKTVLLACLKMTLAAKSKHNWRVNSDEENPFEIIKTVIESIEREGD